MKRPRILVVEDEAIVALMVEDLLEDLGCEVAASFGELIEALTWLAQSGASLDGALLDVNIGGETVFPVADALFAQGTPFGFLTAYSAVPQAKTYAAPLLHKPVDAMQFGCLVASFER